MYAAVAQLAVVQIGLLGTLASQFRDARHSLSLALGGFNLIFQHLHYLLVAVQEVIDLGLYEVTDVFIDRHSIGRHGERAELYLGLRLEDGLLHINRYRRHEAIAYVAVLVFPEELLDSLGNMFLECRLMGTALRGVLAVDKGVILLSVLVGVGECYLDILAPHVDYRVERLGSHLIFQQVLQSVARDDAPAVEHYSQPGVQIGIVAEHRLNDVVLEGVTLEERIVRLKVDIRAPFVLGGSGLVAYKLATLKASGPHVAVAVGAHLKVGRKEVDGFDTHAVHADRLFECLRVVFTAGIELADGLNHLSLRYAAPIVAQPDGLIVNHLYLYAVAFVHTELVNGVVDGLFQQHVDAVVGVRSVAHLADIHTRTGAYVVNIREVSDVFVGVIDGFLRLHCRPCRLSYCLFCCLFFRLFCFFYCHL